MVTTAVSGGCLTSLTKETTMNYKIVAGFLMGVVCMTGLVKWEGNFRFYAHLGLGMLAIIAGWVF